MRAVIIVISSAFLAAIGFGIFFMMQGTDLGHHSSATAAKTPGRTPITTMPVAGAGTLGPGEEVWWDRYDAKGERTSRIRVSTYQPQKDGLYSVTEPQAEFFLHDKSVLRLTGKTGEIVVQESVTRGKNSPGLNVGTSQSPRSGKLRDVMLRLYPTAEAAEPTLTMTMNNASFDNETFRIQTEDFVDERGKRVPADRVPVIVRGDDYDFDGYGLKLQYDELDRKLVYLRVAHGKRLVIKHPNKFTNKSKQAAPATAPATVQANGLLREFWSMDASLLLSTALAAPSGSPAAPRRVRPAPAPATRPQKPPAEQTVYRAVFKDAVVVTQAGQKLASADEMQVDFLSDQDELSPVGGGATQPATAAATRPERPRRARPEGAPRPENASRTPRREGPTTRPVLPVDAAGAPAAPKLPANATTTPSAPGATTQASALAIEDQPMFIDWTGPLTITPVPGDRSDRIAPGEAIVKLIAKGPIPVEVSRASVQGQNMLRCAILTHWTIDQGALLEEGPGIPVEMTSRKPTTQPADEPAPPTYIRTQRMVFSQAEGVALLYGNSHAELPLEGQNKATTQPVAAKVELMKVDWTDRCTLYFQGGLEDMVMQRADLQGNVAVDHPQLRMNAQDLDLYFESPTSTASAHGAAQDRQAAALRQLDAKGKVKCITQGPGGDKDRQQIECENLKLLTDHTPEGKLFARNIVALGQVHAVDPQRDLRSGYLSVTLAAPTTQPTTRPAGKAGEFAAGDLESLVAHDGVQVVMTDGKRADANQMAIEVKQGKSYVTLHGLPDKPAVVTHQKGKISGPIIYMVPDTQQLTISGAGRMDGVQQEAPGKAARPVVITWEKGLDGRGDLIECSGAVSGRSIDADGSVNTFKGERVNVVTTRPATQPSTELASATPAQPAATQVASSKKHPSTQPSSDLDVMADRQIQSVVLQGSAQTDSVLMDDSGKLLKMMHLDAQTIQFFQPEPKKRKLVIPVPGRMLFVDDRPAATQPAAQEAAADPMGVRGQTAFQWDKSLVYDEVKEQVTMSGGIQISRLEQAGARNEPLRVWGDSLVADIEPAPTNTTQPAAAGPDFASKMQLKNVNISGSAKVIGNNLNVEAETIDYDQARHLLIARGTPRKRVIQKDSMDLEIASFDEFVWDTQKSQIISSRNAVFTRRMRSAFATVGRATMSTSPFKFDHVAVPSSDIAQSVRWYQDHFSASVLYQDGTWAILMVGGMKLALVSPQQHPPHVAISVSEEQLAATSHETGIPIDAHRDGTKGIYLHDPFGNAVELICYPAGKTVYGE